MKNGKEGNLCQAWDNSMAASGEKHFPSFLSSGPSFFTEPMNIHVSLYSLTIIRHLKGISYHIDAILVYFFADNRKVVSIACGQTSSMAVSDIGEV